MKQKDNLSIVLHGINDLRLEQTPLPDRPQPNEVQLATHTAGICGSDIHLWTTGRCDSLAVETPFVSGHESSAIVVHVGNNVTNLKVGDRVSVEPGLPCDKCPFCIEGDYNLCEDMIFQSAPPHDGCLRRYYNYRSTFCHKFPDDMSFGEGAIIEPLAVAVHACQRARIAKDLRQTVLVTGAGPIGLLSSMVAKAFGALDICILDANKSRLEFAQKVGIEKTLLVTPEDDTESMTRQVKQLLSCSPNITLECTGAQLCLNVAIAVTRSGGTVVMTGLNHNKVNVSLSNAAHRQLNLIGNRRYRNSFPVAINLVSSGLIDVKPLISHKFKLEDGMKAFETAKSCADGVIKVQIEFS